MLRLTLMGGHWGITWILLQYSLIIFVSSKKQRSLPVRKDFVGDILVLLFSFLSLLFRTFHAWLSSLFSSPSLTFHWYPCSILLLLFPFPFLFRIYSFHLFPSRELSGWSTICGKITNWKNAFYSHTLWFVHMQIWTSCSWLFLWDTGCSIGRFLYWMIRPLEEARYLARRSWRLFYLLISSLSTWLCYHRSRSKREWLDCPCKRSHLLS